MGFFTNQKTKLCRGCASTWQRIRSSPAEAFDAFWDWTRCFFFTLAFLALFCAKILHIYAHLYSLPPSKFFLWGITFFSQDVAFTFSTRILTQKFPQRWMNAIGASLVIPFSIALSGMTSANLSFYVVAGAEINWKQAKTFHRDAAAIRTLLTGLTGFLIVEAILVTIAWFVATPFHRFVGGILHVLAEPFKILYDRVRTNNYIRRIRLQEEPLPNLENYEQIACEDYRDDKSEDGGSEDGYLLEPPQRASQERTQVSVVKRVFVWGPLLLLATLRIARPSYPSYIFLSGALPVTPFGGRNRQSLGDQAGHPADYVWLEGRTSLATPPMWDWLPETPLPGFEDWDLSNNDRVHYTPAEDPLHLSNLQEPVLESLRDVLSSGDVDIKHIFLLKLESTRSDVFPLRNGSYIWDRILQSFNDKPMPESAEMNIANLTRTAEYLTGFDTGFDKYREGKRRAYGGISASNAFTTGTYTLKSLVGTVCGVTPLVADFNREYDNHIYQPCMPHVLNALSKQSDITNKTKDYRTWPWHSVWMQSVTDTYDNQDKLTPKLGYHDIQTKETIERPDAKHYPLTYGEINYYGYPDTELREYIRDAIDDAEANHNRLFLTHLTGTTHHPWGMPNDTFNKLTGPAFEDDNNDFNRYLNTIGFIDNWLAEILGILEEKGIANETLLVMAGDHGLSLPNDGGVTPYSNPHVGSFHVPIVFAHPRLPAIEVADPVISLQIVPTILDLLIESSSLGPNSTHAAKDIQSIYEGQSMIRPLFQQSDRVQNWQFSVMNTGGSWLAVRSAARPAWRIVVPLIDDVEWRFTDVEKDPQETDPIKSFNFNDLTTTLWERYASEDEQMGRRGIDHNYRRPPRLGPPPGHPPSSGPPHRPGHHPPPPPPPPYFLNHDDFHHDPDREYEPEVIQWVRDAAHVADWWILDNWARYQYKKT